MPTGTASEGHRLGNAHGRQTARCRGYAGREVSASERSAQLKESPQAQELPAFGLSIVKPCFSIVSAKSIDAPSR